MQKLTPAQISLNVGDPVLFKRDGRDPLLTKVKSRPRNAGGRWVVSVEGVPGGHSLMRCTPVVEDEESKGN